MPDDKKTDSGHEKGHRWQGVDVVSDVPTSRFSISVSLVMVVVTGLPKMPPLHVVAALLFCEVIAGELATASELQWIGEPACHIDHSLCSTGKRPYVSACRKQKDVVKRLKTIESGYAMIRPLKHCDPGQASSAESLEVDRPL